MSRRASQTGVLHVYVRASQTGVITCVCTGKSDRYYMGMYGQVRLGYYMCMYGQVRQGYYMCMYRQVRQGCSMCMSTMKAE